MLTVLTIERYHTQLHLKKIEKNFLVNKIETMIDK